MYYLGIYHIYKCYCKFPLKLIELISSFIPSLPSCLGRGKRLLSQANSTRDGTDDLGQNYPKFSIINLNVCSIKENRPSKVLFQLSQFLIIRFEDIIFQPDRLTCSLRRHIVCLTQLSYTHLLFMKAFSI